MNRTRVCLDPEQREVLKRIAVDKDTTMTELTRKALDNYILEQSMRHNPKTYVTKEYNQYLIDKINKKRRAS